jgi:hypothetical protein
MIMIVIGGKESKIARMLPLWWIYRWRRSDSSGFEKSKVMQMVLTETV